MKLAYMICMLLGITICSLVLAVPSTTEKLNITTAEPLASKATNATTESTIIPTSTTVTSSTTTSTTTVTTTTPTPTTTSTTTTPSKPTTPSESTTVSPLTTSTNATTTESTTPIVKTTAEPGKTTPSPSKDRHFDGLSFFGGIILATCLMAIAAFSWKFYRQCNERNYRTL